MLRSLAFVLASLAAFAAHGADRVFATDAGAIRGYDPVAYHTERRAVPGAREIVHAWNGATWHFASVENRDRFAADPERYAPRYGGYCAYGTSQGYKVSTGPDAFALVDGVLYLNYNHAVQRTWDGDRPGFIATADENWARLVDEPYVSDEASTK